MLNIPLFPPFASPAPRRSFSHFSRCKKEALRRGRRRNEWVWFPVPLSCSQWCEKEQRFSLRPPQTQSNIGRSRQKQKHRPSSSHLSRRKRVLFAPIYLTFFRFSRKPVRPISFRSPKETVKHSSSISTSGYPTPKKYHTNTNADVMRWGREVRDGLA